MRATLARATSGDGRDDGATPSGVARCTAAALLGIALLSQPGCLYDRLTTNTSRSATEQLLVGDSIRKAVGQLRIPDVKGRALAVEIRAIPSADTEYLKSVLEVRLGEAGARIVAPEAAEFKMVALVGGIGTVARDAAFGLPSLPIPSIGATPAIPFVSASRQRAWTQAQLFTWDMDGALVHQSDPVLQRSRFDITSVLFVEIRRNDVYPNEDGSLAVE